MLKRPAFVHIKINSLSTKPASHQGITYFSCINKWFGYNRSYENDKDNLLAITLKFKVIYKQFDKSPNIVVTYIKLLFNNLIPQLRIDNFCSLV